MTVSASKPVAYLKDGCPFSFKFWLFMVEAGLADQIEIVRGDPSSDEYANIKAKLEKGTGKAASFPTVEIEPGRFLSDSDALIAHFAARNQVDAGRLPALAFYKKTILPSVVELHKIKTGA